MAADGHYFSIINNRKYEYNYSQRAELAQNYNLHIVTMIEIRFRQSLRKTSRFNSFCFFFLFFG